MLEETISDLCEEHRYLLDSSQISDLEKSVMERLIWKKATDQELKGSLLRLTRMMQAHYGKPIILSMSTTCLSPRPVPTDITKRCWT